jgi:protein phosphatase 1 regulatory subunit 7
VSKIEKISHLVHLEEFWANDNQISDFGDLEQLELAKNLETVYFEGNPLQKLTTQYRLKIKLALPSIKQIDALLTRPLDYLPEDR